MQYQQGGAVYGELTYGQPPPQQQFVPFQPPMRQENPITVISGPSGPSTFAAQEPNNGYAMQIFPVNQQNQQPMQEDTAQAAEARKKVENSYSYSDCCQGLAALVITLVVVVGVVVCTVVFAVVLSQQSNDVSTQMLVYTGRRTRDWGTANSYSMYSFEEDQYSRFFVCMKSAGIQVPGNHETIGAYRDAIKKKHDCGPESDRGWPRDIGFLRCIQRHYSVSFHQSNMFLQCLDLTEGVMVENIQTASSNLFLGSYNYVAMLLTAMGVMAGFLIFTTAGYYISSEIKPSDDGDEEQEDGQNQTTPNRAMFNENVKKFKRFMKQRVEIDTQYPYVASAWYWVPLAMLPNSLAFAWSLAMLIACFFYTYPIRDTWSDAVSLNDGVSVFPGTPWTGNLCTGVSFLMGLYFLLCLVEVILDYRARGNVVIQKQMNGTMAPPQDAQESQNTTPVMYRYRNQTPKKSLGARYNPQLYYADKQATKDMSLRMTPPLNKVEALCWVFVDGLLFVGMINSQNSPLNENVVAIWFFIIMCRAFQFAATYFLDDVLFSRYTSPTFLKAWNSRTRKEVATQPNDNSSNRLSRWKDRSSQDGLGFNMDMKSNHFISFGDGDRMAMNPFVIYNNPSNPKFPDNPVRNEVIDNYTKEYLEKIYDGIIHAGIAVVCCHLASLWCLITVIYHFSNAISIPFNLSAGGVGTSVHVIQICFLSFILVMDVIKHAYVFSTVLGWIDQHSFWYFMTITNTADWVLRAVFIICMMFPITMYFGDMSKGLNDYVTTVVA